MQSVGLYVSIALIRACAKAAQFGDGLHINQK